MLPNVTKSWQKLPKVTKNYQKYQKILKVTKSYQKLPKVGNSLDRSQSLFYFVPHRQVGSSTIVTSCYQKLSKVYQKLATVTKSWQYIKVGKNYQK